MSWPSRSAPTPTPAPVLLNQFLQTVSDARATPNPQLLSSCLNADPRYIAQNQLMISLREELIANKHAMKPNTERVLTDEWPGFTELVIGYLIYVVALDPAILWDNGAMIPWFKNLKAYMAVLNPAFNSNNGSVLIPLIKSTTTLLTNFALKIDLLVGDPGCNSSHFAMNSLLRTFNITLGERTFFNGPPTLQIISKKAATLHIANLLFRLYFKLNQNRLCATIHTNIETASIPSYLNLYPKADVVAYKYYLGRQHFFNAHFTKALSTLTSAYDLARLQDLKQRRLILLYMTASAIILGKFPSQHLLARPECVGFAEMFYPLCHAIRLGDFRAFRHALGDEGADTWKRKWWIKWELYLALRNRCQVLLWRGLIRRTYLLTRQTAHQLAAGAKPAPPTVAMNDVLTLGRYLHHLPGNHDNTTTTNPLFLGADNDSDDSDEEEEEEEEEGDYFGLKMQIVDVETAVVSLLDQGFIKGYIARQATGPLIVLSRVGMFPPVAEIYSGSKWKDDGTDLDEVNPFAGGGGGRVINLRGVKAIGE